MKNPKLANRYAKALFDFAGETNKIEVVKQDLEQILSVLTQERELRVVLNSPVIAPAKKRTIFAAVFSENIDTTTFSFIDVMLHKKREPALPEICRGFVQLYNEHHHIKVATLVSAQPMSEELVKRIQALLEEQTHYTIQVKCKVDASIIGGIMVEMDDFRFDATVVSRINKLRQEFSHNVYQVNF